MACSTSEAKKTTILEQSIKRISKVQNTFKLTAPSKIRIKTKDAAYHILQKKHCWDRVVKITGNIDEDFLSVQKLLEELKIYEKKFLKSKPLVYPKDAPILTQSVHQATFNGHEIRAFFESNIETGECYLQNAFVLNPR